MPKHYTEEEKIQYVSLYKTAYSSHEICAKYGMSRSTLLLWAKQYSEVPYEVKTAREVYLLEKEVERLRAQNDIFRLSECSVISSAEEKFLAIEKLKNQFSIQMLCQTLNFRKSTYYHYSLRRPVVTMVAKEDEIFKPLIAGVFEKSGKRFGAKKIRAKLMEQGYTISQKRILRLMKGMDLSMDSQKVYPNATFQREYKYYPNKVKQKFLQEAPNMVWVSDITAAKVGDSIGYLCVVIDLYSRKVIGYSISENPDTKLIKEAVKMAYDQRNKMENLIFHSDKGTQYTSYIFRSFLRKLNITPSYSRIGTPYDNAVAESFFASLKKEEFSRCHFDTMDMLKKSVDEYMDFFNDYRPHQRLNYMTPNQAESAYLQKISS